MIPRHEIAELDRDTAVVAHEAIINLLVNDWSAMDRSQLKEAERALADSLDVDPAYPGE